MSAPSSTGRRRMLRALALMPLAGVLGASCSERTAGCSEWRAQATWPDWQSFIARHAQHDGRIIDFANEDMRSTSESQSYAMILALIADDRAIFDIALDWMHRELAAGRIEHTLPAWLWGRDKGGRWGVLDDNNASDADLWTAYALIEAARLWNAPEYAETARILLRLLKRDCWVTLPGFGPMLLPGRRGFAADGGWTLNPSYLPLPLLRRLHGFDPEGGWDVLAERTVALLEGCTAVGFAPDWARWDGSAFGADPERGVVGGYEAIRVYLWAGMTDAADPLAARVSARLGGPAQMLRTRGRLAERVNTVLGTGTGEAPAGFSAALLPYLAARGETSLADAQRALVPAAGSADAERLPYYERTLVLFGRGWSEGRYRFDVNGRLLPAWSSQCAIEG